jgi:cytochrome b6-f complex iron-sulfur subunit
MSEKRNAGRPVNRKPDTSNPKAGEGAQATDTAMNRREFMAWATAASIALFGASSAVTMVLPDPKSDPLMQSFVQPDAEGSYPLVGGFTYPRIKEGTFGGQFILERKATSYTLDEQPELTAAGKFYAVKVENLPPVEDGGVAGHEGTGIAALYQVCTHLGCLVPFDGGQNRFICPCHGSTFERNGDYVLGPAPRSMDQFEVAVDDDGVVVVDTGKKRTGKHHA